MWPTIASKAYDLNGLTCGKSISLNDMKYLMNSVIDQAANESVAVRCVKHGIVHKHKDRNAIKTSKTRESIRFTSTNHHNRVAS